MLRCLGRAVGFTSGLVLGHISILGIGLAKYGLDQYVVKKYCNVISFTCKKAIGKIHK